MPVYLSCRVDKKTLIVGVKELKEALPLFQLAGVHEYVHHPTSGQADIVSPKPSDNESEAFGQSVRSLRTKRPKPSDFLGMP
jgi:hypothetical protein